MDFTDIKPLVETYHRKLSHISLDFKRYLYKTINWDVRVLGIKGARGTGKTTLILQRIKETYKNCDDAFYVSLDNLWFKTHNLLELIEFLHSRGINDFYLDEVHKYKEWSLVIKNIYDNYPDVNIVYTGSSMLEINNAKVDLSRRQTVYTLCGLSFREYMEYIGVLETEPVSLETLIANHVSIAQKIVSEIKVLKYFDEYLKNGYYPYFKEAGLDYFLRLAETVNLVIENDLPSIQPITYETIEKTKRLMMIVAESLPLMPNVNKLSEALGCTRDTTLSILYNMDKAALLNLLTTNLKSYKHLVVPDKIYLQNTNLMYALGSSIEEGTIRETFFSNQLSVGHSLTMPKTGDFLVNEKYLFEVGGAGKSFKQIADIKDSYIAYDNVETGYGNKIPLWMFGLLY